MLDATRPQFDSNSEHPEAESATAATHQYPRMPPPKFVLTGIPSVATSSAARGAD
jgi:hypothetical protein